MGYTFMQATSNLGATYRYPEIDCLDLRQAERFMLMKCANIERLDRNQGNGASLSYIVAVGMGDHSTY